MTFFGHLLLAIVRNFERIVVFYFEEIRFLIA